MTYSYFAEHSHRHIVGHCKLRVFVTACAVTETLYLHFALIASFERNLKPDKLLRAFGALPDNFKTDGLLRFLFCNFYL